jgi:hypothetical protein
MVLQAEIGPRRLEESCLCSQQPSRVLDSGACPCTYPWLKLEAVASLMNQDGIQNERKHRLHRRNDWYQFLSRAVSENFQINMNLLSQANSNVNLWS